MKGACVDGVVVVSVVVCTAKAKATPFKKAKARRYLVGQLERGEIQQKRDKIRPNCYTLNKTRHITVYHFAESSSE